MNKRVLVTGGAGFVGANLAYFLKRDYPSWEIISLDNLHRRGSELNLPRLQEVGVSFIHGDIRQMEDLDSVGDIDLLLECSAEPSVLAGYKGTPSYLIQTNLVGTLNCLEKCRRVGAEIIFLSTSRVYPIGLINELTYAEEDTRFKLDPEQRIPGVSGYGFSEDLPLNGVRSLYGATKLCSEIVLQEYIAAYGIRGIINRCGVLTGPWQMGKIDQGFVVLWVASHLWNRKLSYIGFGGTGKQVRDVLHVEDLYRLICIEIKRIEQLSGKVFNVGGGQDRSISLCELSRLCQEITGREISITPVLETRQGDIPYYVSDCRQVQKMTGWNPRWTVKDTVSDICQWLQEHERVLKPILS